MAENKVIDNSQLELAAETFAKDRTKENFVKIMEHLEKAVVYMPTMMPDNLDKETMDGIRGGKGVKLPKDAKILPCLLKKDSGEQALPIFSSLKQVPPDKKSPAIMALPFFNCVSMAMANKEKVQAVVLNPFTQNVTLPPQILEIAQKRGQAAKPQKVKLTEKQFHQMAHGLVAYQLLPVFLYEKQKDGLEQLQQEEGKFLASLYASVYPKEIRMPYGEDDFSLMTLNVTDDMQITRIDMPEANLNKGLCCRIYAVWKREAEELSYYTIEKAENGNTIGRIYADKKHEIIEAAPDNGAEIETIMNLCMRESN
ncbi:MAG: SseB family protein [Lachnospiraceae bacterium]|nr:SseB family protein [Lachnospiraceae bacterium]